MTILDDNTEEMIDRLTMYKPETPVLLINDDLAVTLRRVDYDEETKIAKIVFIESESFKKVIRHDNIKGVRTPIYSDVQHKSKPVDRIIRLDEEGLLNLNKHIDRYIKHFSFEIIKHIEKFITVPDWYNKVILDYNVLGLKSEITKENSDVADMYVKYHNKFYDSITKSEDQRTVQKAYLDSNTKRLGKYQSKLNWINRNRKRNTFLLRILTLGLSSYYLSTKREYTINFNVIAITGIIADLNKKIEALTNTINSLREQMDEHKDKYETLSKNILVKTNDYKDLYDRIIQDMTILNERWK